MQVSIQTQRKKKNNFANQSFSISSQLELAKAANIANNSNNESDQKEKKIKLKRLTQINRELIETLKKQNDELTKKISKQKGKATTRSFSVSTQQTPKYLESTKKQLSNAYNQIEMYKTVLQNLKAKQISTDSLDKVNMLENKIKMEDQAIEQLQKQLKFLKNIKDQQQKELEVFENDQIKKNVAELEEEVKNIKEKLKIAKKQAQKRQQLEKKQHTYYIELQKLLRKQNDEYYPGKQETKKDFHKGIQSHLITQIGAIESHISNQITEREWQNVKNQLKEQKRIHQENNKKVELLSRLRNRQLKSFEQNELKLKEKLKKLQQLKNKLAELTKLVTIKEKKQDQNQSEDQQEDKGEKGANNNATKKPKNGPNKQRQLKRWVIPQGYALQKGKILSQAIFFSDKTILTNVKKSKIIQIHVWTDSEDTPCLLQFFYSCEKGKKYEGIQPYSKSISHLEQNVIAYKQGDYLYKIQGKMDNGYLTSLTLTSKFGQKRSFTNESSTVGDVFKFEPKTNQLPSCLFGAIVKNADDEIRICHIGCEFISDW